MTAPMIGAFTTVRSAGGLLPVDTLTAVLAGRGVSGLDPADYGLVGRETLREAANRSFTRLQAAWTDFRRVVPPGPVTGAQTEVTRNRWLRVLFEELGYGRLPAAPAGGITVTGPTGTRAYPVSHLWGRSPVHLLGAGLSLDHRTPGVAGAATAAPHSLVQELLNRSPDLLWGFVANGLRLRLLRDSASLVRQAYVEFDLEAMFDGEVFADFTLLWLVAHASRVEPRPDGDARPDTCWLETWRAEGVTRGTRALTALRDGVAQALTVLGRGFLRHPDNAALRTALADGTLPGREYYRLLLRVVYQLLVLFVAEDRALLHPPDAPAQARQAYAGYFSTDRLRRLARRRLTGGRHHDLWTAHQLVLRALGSEGGLPDLALPGLGGIYEPDQLGALGAASLTNVDLLTAIRALSVTRDEAGLPRQVDYRNLGAEELGGVYESLLELVPHVDRETGAFTLDIAAGHERKTTGSYYTPPGLVEILLDEALDPVLDAAAGCAATDPAAAEKALLALTVCDPACGSGHFLAAAARRVARRLAAVRTGEAEPPVEATQHAMRDVVAHCIYGVDLNPLAAELTKVALWLEALDPGRPFSFLDAHIKVGNALIGTTPDLVAAGLPEDAFTVLTGDDRDQVVAYRKRNRDELRRARTGYDELPFADPSQPWRARFQKLANLPEGDLTAVHDKRAEWLRAEADPGIARARLAADAWCAAFAWPHRLDPDKVALAAERTRKTGRGTPHAVTELRADPPPPTTNDIAQIDEVGAGALTADQLRVLAELRDRYRFFHWPLEFPDVLPGGFSCVLGNPPWEKIKLQDKEFFAARDPEIAKAANAAARKKMLARLADERPGLWAEYQRALRDSDSASHFAHSSGRYPLTGRGDINTAQIFTEHNLTVSARRGRFGIIVPNSVTTGDTTAAFFRHLIGTSTLAGLFDFENEAKIFPGVNNRVGFALLIATGGTPVRNASFASLVQIVQDLPARRFRISPQELLQVNPNSGTAPVFRSRRDAEITIAIHRRIPILIREATERVAEENPWDLSFLRMLDMANDSKLFDSEKKLVGEGWAADGNIFFRGDERMLPLFEAKMLHHYDHRFATYDGATQAHINKGTLPRLDDARHDDPDRGIWPRYWVSEENVDEVLSDRWDRGWLLGWRDIARNDEERTLTATVLPLNPVGHTAPLILASNGEIAGLQANLSSLVLDYVARQKLGGAHVTFGLMEQLPVLPPEAYVRPTPWEGGVELRDWVADRVVELSYTSWDLAAYAEELHDDGPPFRWVPERRAQIRAELDAAYLHLYGLARDEAEHVIDSFFVLRKNEEKAFGEFRTRRLVLAAYDAMSTGTFASPLDPPPGQGPRHPDRSRA
ncbi:DNA methyltransferase [Frankia sp. QA3]|uniref:Eco57I restriction-modification methylase domain-containing protein n=1 Tax=Frankia sp. QA3 TaxID=710111 RepID=UPI000269BCAE|nr:DNA methyltransferase [Frankia sp. QA3]EIV91780.1 N-6 DNA Methylase [Frankia sp. QA3]